MFKPIKQKTAFITGCTGQDGSYLTELLLNKGYIVHGFVRRSSSFNRGRIEHIYTHPDLDIKDAKDIGHNGKFYLHYGDMTDSASLVNALARTKPDEIYNLAAQSHVQISFETPLYTAHTSGIGVLNLLEAVRILGLKSKIYQASTSELYSGDPKEAPQNEYTAFKPKSPYGVAKLYGFEIGRIYREAYGMFIVNGILFNHESERRGENFVTRKITKGIGEILKGKRDFIYLGNLDASRDWGYAPEYMEAAWLMLQQDKPEDFVIATGKTHTVREFAEEACCLVGLNHQKIIKISEHYIRPSEVDYLCGDASKSKRVLGWSPKTHFKDLVRIMVEHDAK
ncbi:MAG: GDP-D-mannose dehydratase [Parcubacteria group bacterium GW2011_GWB1_41_6]|nr:MAG: GDP-D-mannose dehydratase [Parcubacteria group bacterium GW2011_GWB1_41_6]